MSEPDVVGEFGVCFFVTQFVSDMSEPCMLRVDAMCPADCLLDGGMAGMRFMTKRRKYNVVQIA